jgi:hypothetical protein
MWGDFNLIKKSHNLLIYSFLIFFLQYNNIVKIIITINSNPFLYLKENTIRISIFKISIKMKILETI